jgi:shikimate dehydrogenase
VAPGIDGSTEIIAHIGFPTHTFKSPQIYNPYFAAQRINAVVVPLAVAEQDFEGFVRQLFRAKNIRGALITMPHKISVTQIADVLLPTAQIAGSANALRVDEHGALVADMFDGEGFVRGILRKGFACAGARALVVGAGGVGSAIAASLAKAGVAEVGLHDVHPSAALALAGRLREHYRHVRVGPKSADPAGYDLVVNATPLGMNDSDPMPFGVSRLESHTFVGEVVMKSQMTPLLTHAARIGCRYQIGTDMLFEMIPAYLDFFGFPLATADELRATAQISY